MVRFALGEGCVFDFVYNSYPSVCCWEKVFKLNRSIVRIHEMVRLAPDKNVTVIPRLHPTTSYRGSHSTEHILLHDQYQYLVKSKERGRKFLDRFKNYFRSQISPQSLNEVHIYRLQPKSATKGDFFHIFLSSIVASRRHGLQMANEADEVLLGKRPR